MKILITGANSYIGTSFESHINKYYSGHYTVDTVDTIDGSWREKDFSGYAAIFHVAGIAHQKETKQNTHLYYEINRDLAIDTAKKAKESGVKQFVFLSTMSVYGMETGIITRDTIPNPKNNYGKSKFQAEEGIISLQNASFKVAIVRPPMVYGNGCKGNYQMLVKCAKHMAIFPNYYNQRSMIHINNLSEFIVNLIKSESEGLFLPQDEQYICTCKMVQEIAKSMNKDIKLLKILNPFVSVLKLCTKKGKKAFGNLIYKL